ncbi:MAG: hydrogenase 4 subunit F [Desulfitobacteriaceae bacterium]
MLISLLVLPLLTALLTFMAQNRRLLILANLAGGALMAGISLVIAYRVFSAGPMEGFAHFIYIDALSAFIIMIVAIVGLAAGVYSVGYTAHNVRSGEISEKRLNWYYLWFYVFIFSMLCVVVAGNLGIMWVAIEATTLASALLVGFYDKKSSLEAAWKYIIICTVGIIFALFGTILLHYAAVAVTGDGGGSLDWQNLIRVAKDLNPKLLKLAFVFILVGYGTKVGLAPMHTWLPDAHSQAPSPVSAMLSGVLLNCALYGILRFHLIVSKSLGTAFSANLLLIFGILSIAIALPFIVAQHDIKRLLAYSSIEHMGIITAAVGLGSHLALYGAFLHMMNHALTKSFLFFGAGNVTQHYRTKKIGKIKGAILAMPISGTALLLGAFAIAGAPPFNIFLSEFTILSAGFAEGKYLAAGLMLSLITLIFTGVIYNVGKMTLGTPPGRITQGEPSRWSTVMLLIPVVPIIVLGFYIPPFIDNILRQVVTVMAGGN